MSIIEKELRKIAADNGGLLRPQDVVEIAAEEGHPLHNSFCWDDSRAAHEFRLWQARQMIRSIRLIVQVPDMTPVNVRAFVSLTPDRKGSNSGYRETIKVVKSASLREIMLADAKAEMDAFVEKYNTLAELQEVIAAIKKTKLTVG